MIIASIADSLRMTDIVSVPRAKLKCTAPIVIDLSNQVNRTLYRGLTGTYPECQGSLELRRASR